MNKYEYPCTKYYVDLAMEMISKDVQLPKCVRDGLIGSEMSEKMNEFLDKVNNRVAEN